MDFTSDNAAGVAPEILDAVAQANVGAAASYGDDEVTARLQHRFSEIFEREVTVFPVVTGTAANALALAAVTPPHGAVMCHELAHAYADECGAPEMFSGGAKLIPVAGAGAKIDPDALRGALASLHPGIVHNVQPTVLSLTQSTERGTVYSVAEVAALVDIARGRGLRVHMDGARFGNALATLGVAPAEITWKAGVDIMSFGATKNGALAAEAVIVFNPEIARDLVFRRKRAGHLVSKMRFLSAQLEAYLHDGLWLRLAAHANEMASRLAAGLAARPDAELHAVPQANEIFVRLPVPVLKRLEAGGARFYLWPMPGDTNEICTIRLVASFQTGTGDVDGFLRLMAT